MSGNLYSAKSTFTVSVNGRRTLITKGTTVREGHPILDGLESMFELFTPDYEFERTAPKKKAAPKTEQATAAPGEVRELSNSPSVSDES